MATPNGGCSPIPPKSECDHHRIEALGPENEAFEKVCASRNITGKGGDRQDEPSELQTLHTLMEGRTG